MWGSINPQSALRKWALLILRHCEKKMAKEKHI
jgi:hypothetical protein